MSAKPIDHRPDVTAEFLEALAELPALMRPEPGPFRETVVEVAPNLSAPTSVTVDGVTVTLEDGPDDDPWDWTEAGQG